MPNEAEREAEQMVLGAMMSAWSRKTSDGDSVPMNSAAISEVQRIITAEQMFSGAHQAIFTAVVRLEQAGETGIDPVMVMGELQRVGLLGKIEGAYLHTLFARVTTATNATYYAEKVKGAADRRAAFQFAERVRQFAIGDPERLQQATDTAYTAFMQEIAGSAADSLKSVSDDSWLLTDILDTWGQQSPSAMTTGLIDVDDLLNVNVGGLVVVGARSGVGKSVFAAQLARHYVFDKALPAVFFSLEMTRRQLYERDLAALAGVPLGSAEGKVSLDDFQRHKLVKAAAKYEAEGALLFYDDTPHISLAHIRSTLSQMRHQWGNPGLVVVDYIQLMDLPRRDREDQAIGEVTTALKEMANEFQCIIIAVAQLNRKAEERPGGVPQSSDLRGSGQIEQDADVIFLLHDAGKYDEARTGEVDIWLAKQRKGQSGVPVTVADYRNQAQFKSMAKE
ncbi:DnaB-like helicase C-terminal domain-containing protein [Amycolatopsis sp. DSM 110486]|uniref:replicative DNA helicase n=1 Tax=Amycolatopsis sp. DSM 110486 TaxID=2865832 RepID=UPI001C6A497D|nr:DnaB-like helicase C-terminal domain-containing protein [Amycolatopsis sp. DSM 110486]QYN17469.1 AAA family ATPase [Amycolatopsis sp. DSM 110486]